MSGIDQLRSIGRKATPFALNIYDKEEQASKLPRLATVLDDPDLQDVIHVEWAQAFPQLREWVGDRATQEVFGDKIALTPRDYEITYNYNRKKLASKHALVKLQPIIGRMGREFSRGKVQLAYNVLRDNPLSYDGQNFFDTDHTHPTGDTFKNLLTISRSAAGKPTVAEARSELKKAMAQLMENRLIRNSLVDTAEITEMITVIAKSFDVWSAYMDLLMDEEVGGEPNRFKGKFAVMRDFDPVSGDEESVDYIYADPDGPRPAIFVVQEEVKGVEFDTTQSFRNKMVDFGMDATYACGAGFPQTAVRLQE